MGISLGRGKSACAFYSRDSRAVAEKPRIVEGPKDKLVQENSDVFFHCQASGEPEPTIIWKKVDGQIPQGRSVIEISDRT